MVEAALLPTIVLGATVWLLTSPKVGRTLRPLFKRLLGHSRQKTRPPTSICSEISQQKLQETTLSYSRPHLYVRSELGSNVSTPFGLGSLRMTAQLSVPVAIPKADAAAAEGPPGAVVELIVDPAMVSAIRAAAGIIDHTMIAKTRRQRQRTLPIRFDDGSRGQRPARRRRRAERRSHETAGKGKRRKQATSKGLHDVTLSDEVTIDGASRAVRGRGVFHKSIRDRGTSGKETVNCDPLSSSLTTSMRPL